MYDSCTPRVWVYNDDYILPSMSSDTGVRRISPVNSQAVFLASMPDVPSNTCNTQCRVEDINSLVGQFIYLIAPIRNKSHTSTDDGYAIHKKMLEPSLHIEIDIT